jgi:hypothetical protein
MLDQMASLVLPPIVDAVTRLLSGLNASPDNASMWRRQPISRDLAAKCWDAIGSIAPPTVAGRGWVEMALNHPAGHLASFWAAVVYDDWRDSTTSGEGLAERMAAHLEVMLSCTDFRGSMVQVVFASQLRLFHNVDSAWCNQNLSLNPWKVGLW